MELVFWPKALDYSQYYKNNPPSCWPFEWFEFSKFLCVKMLLGIRNEWEDDSMKTKARSRTRGVQPKV
jgi:hypothetical protein